MSDEFKIISTTNQQVNLQEGAEHQFSNRILHYAEIFTSVSDHGEMLFQKISLEYADIWYSYYHMFRDTVLYGVVDRPILEAHITLGNKYVQSIGKKQPTIFDKGQFNLTAAPYMENKVWFPKEGEYLTFDIHPSIQILEKLATDFPLLDKFIHKLHGGLQNTTSLYNTMFYLSPDMEYIALKILRHLRSDEPKKSFTEVLVTELLILLLMRKTSTLQQKWKLSLRDIDALQQARELIIEEAEKLDSGDLYATSIQLAEQVNLSLYKFKRGFKELFGISPYKLLTEIRLYKARVALRDTRLSILEIALSVGYNSPEGFSRAYKKLFGISPSDERK
jgi:AraC-like DNA-binding protein